MRSFWHPTFDFLWWQIAHWATPVADSLTWVAHWCSLKMLCLLEFQAHNGQVAAALLPNLCISNRLLSNVAVQPPAKWSSMTFFAKTYQTLVFPVKNGTYPEDTLCGRGLTGSQNAPCVPLLCSQNHIKTQQICIIAVKGAFLWGHMHFISIPLPMLC